MQRGAYYLPLSFGLGKVWKLSAGTTLNLFAVHAGVARSGKSTPASTCSFRSGVKWRRGAVVHGWRPEAYRQWPHAGARDEPTTRHRVRSLRHLSGQPATKARGRTGEAAADVCRTVGIEHACCSASWRKSESGKTPPLHSSSSQINMLRPRARILHVSSLRPRICNRRCAPRGVQYHRSRVQTRLQITCFTVDSTKPVPMRSPYH